MFNDKKNYRNKTDFAEAVTINNKYFWRKGKVLTNLPTFHFPYPL